eukprot:TRINITY_DN11090_c0_g1_i2.p1 TRINITY_DN11090_c0_g1~~TRINITY_DN11090_c0_g1_i2.p1  ORF type:complete len:512 (+),score=99.88 TRINITY_DN11090_c0_g1_i2:51-1538(+)
MKNWFEDPVGRADEEVTQGGLSGMRKSLEAQIANADEKGKLEVVRGMVQDVSSSQHFLMSRRGEDGRTILFGEDDGSDGEMFGVFFAYVVPVPLQGVPPQRGVKRTAHDAVKEQTPYCFIDTNRNIPFLPGTDSAPGYVVRFAIDGNADCDDAAPKINDIVEFFGFSQSEPSTEERECLPFSHLSPGFYHPFSGLLWRVYQPRFSTELVPRFPALRAALLGHLTSVFRGDALTAELLLLHLIGNVVSHDPVPLGCIPLNIVGVTDSNASPLLSVLKEALPSLAAYQVTVAELNQPDWLPVMDYETEHLRTGKLQLPPTYMVLDETVMATGRLNEMGVRNLQALQSLASTQRVMYPCGYSFIEITTNVPVLVLSQSPSLLKVATVVPWVPQEGQVMEVEGPLPLEFKDYISACKGRCVNLTSGIDEHITRTISDVRQQHGKKYNDSSVVHETTIHCWMTLARLHAISLGEPSVTPAHWDHIVQLGTEMLSRQKTPK